MDATLTQDNLPPIPFNLADAEAIGARRAQYLAELDGRSQEIIRERNDTIGAACGLAEFKYRELSRALRHKYGLPEVK